MQPGETITPGAGQPSAPAPEPEKQEQVAPVEAQVPQLEPQPPAPASTSEPEAPASNWQFSNDTSPEATPESESFTANNPVTWNASEFIAHNKGSAWFILLGAGILAFVAGIFVLTRDIFASIMIGVAGATFGVFAARSPRVLEYSVDSRGIHIGPKFYAYSDFKSFAINEESALPSVILMPLKRFLPPITIYYEEAQEDSILGVLGDYLPHEEKAPDAVDRLMSRIRF